MTNLSAKNEALLVLMAKDAEHARRGFELILKRSDADKYFDALIEKGFFEPNQDPPVVEAEKKGQYYIPFWDALGYLHRIATLAGERHDIHIATKVIEIVQAIGRAQKSKGEVANYRTSLALADIVGVLPLEVLSPEDMDFIPLWLRSRFDRTMVGRSLTLHLLPKLLLREQPEYQVLTTRAVFHCMALRWKSSASGNARKGEKAETVIDDYWLLQFVDEHSQSVGKMLRKEGVEIFLDRLREIFDVTYQTGSWLGRPAVEDHSQNHEWNGAENCYVVGARDSMQGWVDVDLAAAREFVARLIRDPSEIVRRIAIHTLNARWDVLRGIYLIALDSDFLRVGHLHEVFVLFQERFSTFSKEESDGTLAAIRSLPSKESPEREVAVRRYQKQLISSIRGRGSPPADSFYAELDRDEKLGALPAHPDFISYMEVWSGFGSSPYSPSDLLGLLGSGEIVLALNEFVPSGEWRTPTERGLSEALEQAVISRPSDFEARLDEFLNARHPYQHAIINAYKRLWETNDQSVGDAAWAALWPTLLAFFKRLVGSAALWEEPALVNELDRVQKRWIPPLIADFVRAGSNNDSKAFAIELVPRALSLLEQLSMKTEGMDSGTTKDPLGEAINTPKGRVLEATIVLMLRACRIADRSIGTHTEIEERAERFFDREISRCRNDNFAFSAIAGLYLGNIDYIAQTWTSQHLTDLFPLEFPGNLNSALEGLAYSQPAKNVYLMLRDQGVVDLVLSLETPGEQGRAKLIERMALAYIWGDDNLESTRLVWIFEHGSKEDISKIVQWFWNISGHQLEAAQSTRVMAFAYRCIEWIDADIQVRSHLLVDLVHLAPFISALKQEEIQFLEKVAPASADERGAEDFFQELLRLLPLNPSAISNIFEMSLSAGIPSSDYNGTIRRILEALVAHDQRPKAIGCAEKLRQIDGVREFYMSLV